LRVRGAGDGPGGAVGGFDAGDAGLAKTGGKLTGEIFRGKRNKVRAPADGLRVGFVNVAAGCERGDGIAIGKLLDDGKGASADGAGGTEDGETFQFSL